MEEQPRITWIDWDLPCVGCGYNLRTHSAAGFCPECGMPIRRTLHRNSLEFGNPSWIRRILWGTRILFLAHLVFVFVSIVSFSEERQSPLRVIAVACALLLLAVWLLTAREDEVIAKWYDHLLRLSVRLSAVGVFFAGTLASAYLQFKKQHLLQVAYPLAYNLIPCEFLLFLWLRRLHSRARGMVFGAGLGVAQWWTSASAASFLLLPMWIGPYQEAGLTCLTVVFLASSAMAFMFSLVVIFNFAALARQNLGWAIQNATMIAQLRKTHA